MNATYQGVVDSLTKLRNVCNAGFALAAEIEFQAPAFLFQTYPEAWQEEYSNRGFVLKDPTVAWGFSNEGVIGWEELHELDSAGIFEAAKRHGLRHGLAMAQFRNGKRNIASFVRHDRAFTKAEVQSLTESFTAILAQLERVQIECPEDVERIKSISLALTHI